MKTGNAPLGKLLSWLAASALLVQAGLAWSSTEANWDRASAVAVARSVDSFAVRQGLMELTIAGSTVELLELLTETSTRKDWPGPAREAVLFAYTQQLRSLPAGTVPREAMAWLKSYRPSTLVPHEDHASASVPLYNIRAVAAGVEHGWLRQAALLEGLALVAANPRSLVDVFLIEGHPAARAGYLDTLDQATPEQLLGVGKSALGRLERHVELTPLAGRAALLAGDLDALSEVFSTGGGPDLAPLMRASASRIDAAESTSLLAATIERASTGNAALAIAELGPTAARSEAAQAILLVQLDHPELGAPAALALARHASPATLKMLETMAESGESLAASRASLALRMGREGLREEARP